MSGLQHNREAIFCGECGRGFEVPRRVLDDPHRLAVAKESIEKKHRCAERGAKIDRVQVYRAPVGKALDEYWATAMRKMAPALN